MKKLLRWDLFAFVALIFHFLPCSVFAQGTAFTYQGRLNVNGGPANGLYDFNFTVYDAPTNGNTVADKALLFGVGVTNGLFTVTLDYGTNVFTGAGRWMEIVVRTNNGSDITTLSPRQPMTPSPYAIFAGGANAGGLTGLIPPASIGPNSITGGQLAPGAAAANLGGSGPGAVPQGGIVMSERLADTNFLGAGFISLGTSNLIATNFWTILSNGPPPVGIVSVGRSGHQAVWTGTDMLVIGGSPVNIGLRYNLASNLWTPMNMTNAPSIGGAVAVWSGSRLIVFDAAHNAGGSYNPSSDSWQTMSTANMPTEAASAVWTGTYMVVWGRTPLLDVSGNVTNTGGGARYNPTSDTWSAISQVNNPLARNSYSSIWSGSEMIVYGGESDFSSFVGTFFTFKNDGGRYNPTSDTWTPITISSGRAGHSAVWTGSRMIVWGGFITNSNGFEYLNTGLSYDPTSGSSSLISSNGAPSGRMSPDAVWNGSQMIIWNGSTFNGPVNSPPDGSRYTPGTDSWSAMANNNEPTPKSGESAIAAGTQMIVWGGSYSDTGGIYNPTANTWTPTPIPQFLGEPGPRSQETAVWTGNSLIVWGGLGSNGPLRTGGIFNPNSNTWISTPLTNAPSGRSGHTAVWTGTDMIVWGGAGSVPVNTGARFNVASNAWFPISSSNAPEARTHHTAIWTGQEMIVFGGYDQTNGLNRTFLNDGGRYNPVTDTWTNISKSIFFAQSRASHTAVWTGTEMIIWGGYTDSGGISPTFNYIATGGRYNPATDGWIGLPLGGPVGRRFHTAVWTGGEMIVWGGQTSTGSTNTGARYNLASNVWTTLSTNNAPAARERHTAVWNDHLRQMIICAGYSSLAGSTTDTGAIYDPAIDQWITILVIPPGKRMDHNAVWTGTQMIVFDGTTFPGDLNTGAAYTPAKIYYFYQKP